MQRSFWVKLRWHLTVVSFLGCILETLGCASRLPRDRVIRQPPKLDGLARLDTSSVQFNDLATGQPVNLGRFMREAGLDHLLLTFGSKNCAACSRKAKALTEQVIGRHSLFLTDAGKRFAIVGVNTDPVPERLGAYLKDFPFVRWSDPGGQVMVATFAPSGSRFRVPLTVMVRRDGILWRILPDEHVSLEAMMRLVESSLGIAPPSPPFPGESPQSPDSPEQSDDGKPGGQGGPSLPTGPSALARVSPGRFNGIQLVGCDGNKATLGGLFQEAAWRFVTVTRGECEGECIQTYRALRGLAETCREAGLGGCKGVTLAGLLPSSGASSPLCARNEHLEGVSLVSQSNSAHFYLGGEEFLRVFAGLFDWRYPRDVDVQGQPYLTKNVDGPLTLGFKRDGTLFFSREGQVTVEELALAIRNPDPSQYAPGPDFKLYRPGDGVFGFASWRVHAEYTVVSGWSTMCASCDALLKHWSQPGQLVDFCASRPGACQLGAVENAFPGSIQGLPTYYESLLSGVQDDRGQVTYDGFRTLGIRVPLLLDPVADGPGPQDYLGRLHDGYMLAVSRDVPAEHANDFRTFIYDREGKIVASFYGEELKDGEDDAVLRWLKQALSKETLD